ncbi:hypothetical protein Leryth_020928 [Lithospermum erythrorhizon]|nr:hypothetical protein Leryth_020928 [Lithospermum erythrorhizon]
MYFARGSNVYNRQQQQQQQQQPQQQQQQQSPYSPHSAYVPKLGSGYPGSSAGLAEGSIGLRQSSMLRSHQEPEVSGFRDHTTHLSNAPNYGGGQYSLTYGGSTTQQIADATKEKTKHINFEMEKFISLGLSP